MRFVVLLFGFIGVLLTTAAGGAFFFYLEAVGWLATQQHVEIPVNVMGYLRQTESLTKQPHLYAALFCFLAALFGLFGTILGFLRCGKQGGLLMLVPVLGAAMMDPFSLVLTSMQLITALMSFFVGPLPINAEPEDDE